MAGILASESAKRIGYLVGARVLCDACTETDRTGNPRTAFYFVNAYPYRQTCHGCNALICRGQSDAWSVLFPKPQEWLFTIRTHDGSTLRRSYFGTYRAAHLDCERDHGPWITGGNGLASAYLVNEDGTTRPMVLGDIDPREPNPDAV